jgi:RNA polymerase sigma-70 factor (ECF subfamily)
MKTLAASHDAATRPDQLFQLLVADHSKALVGYADKLLSDRHLAEDIVQEALIRAWRHTERLYSTKGSVRGWLLTVTRNLVVDRARARAARPQEVAETPITPPMVDDHADQTVTSVALFEALGQLSDEHRAVLIELYFNDRSVIDAAATLGVPVGTVKSRSYYALRQLRDQVNRADLQ